MPSTASPTSRPMRCFISRAALLVKVTARIWLGIGEAGGQDMGDAGGEHARLAGAGAGQHQHRAFGGLDGEPLLGVQALEIVGGWLRPCRAAMARAAMPDGAPAGRAEAPRGRRVLVEEGHVVRKAWHQTPNVVIRAGKARKDRRTQRFAQADGLSSREMRRSARLSRPAW